MNHHNKDIGRLGEEIVCKYLVNQGYIVIFRNYYKPWGELDIVAKKGNCIHFFEVKSIVWHLNSLYKRPEENVNGRKVKQLRKIISTFLNDQFPYEQKEFFIHVVCVYLNMEQKTAKIKLIKNVII